MNESQCGFQIFAEINRNKESVYKVQGMEEGIDLTDFCEALFRMNLGIGVDDVEGGRADGVDFARDFGENDFSFDAIPQFNTQDMI